MGWVTQVLVNQRSGYLVDGHLRVELAFSKGEPSVPVTYVDLSEDEERTVLATLVPLATIATADAAKLEELLPDLTPSDDALLAMLDELARHSGIKHAGLTDPDELPPVPDQADVYVKPGDLWRLGEHRLLCGDATKPEDVARLLGAAAPRDRPALWRVARSDVEKLFASLCGTLESYHFAFGSDDFFIGRPAWQRRCRRGGADHVGIRRGPHADGRAPHA